MNNFSDIELLNELIFRLKKNQEDLVEKDRLLRDLESMNEKLIHSEKVKSEFLSNIRNEINNPLSSIIGLSSIIASGVTLSDESDTIRKAQLIYEEALKLNFQLRNIFVAAEIEAGKLNLEISKIKIVELIHNLIEGLKWQATKKNIVLNVNYTPSLVDFILQNDAEKISTIVSNLISNAIEFSHENSEIQINLNEDYIEIKDFGIGIAKENQNKIFDRFVQLNSGSTKLYAGHGLGLAIVKDLSELINSEIELNSEENKGSSFKLKLKQFEGEEMLGEAMDGNEFLFDNDEDVLF